MLANDGSVAGKYNKLHLFDVDIKGGARLKESDGCVAGKELPPVVKTPVGNVGLAIVSFNSLSLYIYIYIYIISSEIIEKVWEIQYIKYFNYSAKCPILLVFLDIFQQCYDLRFPELSLILAQQGADILTYPSAFTFTTGAAHWEVGH